MFKKGSLKLSIIAALLILLVGCVGPNNSKNINNGEIMSDLSEIMLPFPQEEVSRSWDVGDGTILIERAVNRDIWFYLSGWHKDDPICIIFPDESAIFLSREKESLFFLARGGYDTANYDFPYRLTFGLDTGNLEREAIYLPLTQAVAFGKGSWKQDLVGLEIDNYKVIFDFIPREGEVLAGGQNRPLTTVNYLEDFGELVLRFYNVQDKLSNREGSQAQVSIMEQPGQELARLDSTLLGKGFPYGLFITDLSHVGDIVTEVRLEVNEAEGYRVDTIPLPSWESGIRYVLHLLTLEDRIVLPVDCNSQEQDPDGSSDDTERQAGKDAPAPSNTVIDYELEIGEVVSLVVQAVDKFWYAMGGGSGERPDEGVVINGIHYRYLGSDVGTKEKLLSYMQEIYTEEASRDFMEANIREHEGLLIQSEADGGCILEWEKAQVTLISELKDAKEYELKVPYADREWVTRYVRLKKVAGQGWRIDYLKVL